MEFLDFLVINVAQTRFKAVIYAQTQQPSFFLCTFVYPILKWNRPAKFHETLCPAKTIQDPHSYYHQVPIYLLNCLVDQTFAEETTKESKTYYHIL